jgi:hypothetical protein
MGEVGNTRNSPIVNRGVINSKLRPSREGRVNPACPGGQTLRRRPALPVRRKRSPLPNGTSTPPTPRVGATDQRHVSWRDRFRVVATDPVSGVITKVRAHRDKARVGGTVVRSRPAHPNPWGRRSRRAPCGWRIGLRLPGAIPGWGSTIPWSHANRKASDPVGARAWPALAAATELGLARSTQRSWTASAAAAAASAIRGGLAGRDHQRRVGSRGLQPCRRSCRCSTSPSVQRRRRTTRKPPHE